VTGQIPRGFSSRGFLSATESDEGKVSNTRVHDISVALAAGDIGNQKVGGHRQHLLAAKQ
jgi:hypothetical protein